VSLRARILLLFVGFSVLPVVFLVAGDYFHSVQTLRVVLEARGSAVAEQTARELEAAHTRASAALVAAMRLPAADGPVGPFAAVRPAPGNGADVDPCGPAVPVHLRRRSDDGAIQRVVADLPAETLLAWAPGLLTRLGKEGFTQVLERGTGRLLFDSRCLAAAGAGTSPAVFSASSEVSATAAQLGNRLGWSATVRDRTDLGEDVVSLSAAGPAWVVAVHTNAAEYVGPFRQARVFYLVLVLLVLGIAAGAFLLLAGGSFRSLRLVTAAADQIELGNLRPWLPPPGDDEVGRLSLAFRRMTDRLEASLRRAELSQKLAAVGELATYLSHEIRNPLSSIRLGLQSLHRDLKLGYIPPDAPRVMELALAEVNRLDGVVRAVLEMGRPAAPADGRTCHAHAALEQTLEVLRPKLKARGVDLEYSPRASRDLVEAEPEGLRSVVINLVVNALDALDGHGDGRIRISTWSGNGDELHIRIADNGSGVTPDVAAQIFEPFFTTKARGNGIGLPTALRTVQAWGGTIVYEPVAAGSGAVFVVKLKQAGADAGARAGVNHLMTGSFPA
jgi:signal transduction histidine kinase